MGRAVSRTSAVYATVEHISLFDALPLVRVVRLGCGHRLLLWSINPTYVVGQMHLCEACTLGEETIVSLRLSESGWGCLLSCGHTCGTWPYQAPFTRLILPLIVGTTLQCTHAACVAKRAEEKL